MTAPQSVMAPPTLTIDLDAIAANYRMLAALAPDTAIGAVVKADGYGLGAAEVTPVLIAEGARHVFVAELGEAAELLRAIPDLTDQAELFVLSGIRAGEETEAAALGVTPVIGTQEGLAAWRTEAALHGRKLPAALQIDTGMARMGLPFERALSLAGDDLDGIRLSLVMSHLACADDPAHPLSHEQRTRFASVERRFRGVPASLANSAGILLGPTYHFDLCRPGIALYGGEPRGAAEPVPLAPVVRLDAPILEVRDIMVGEPAGYGASFIADRPTRLATLGVGYADGYLRHLSNRAEARLGGHTVRAAGRISMDLTVFDVTDVPEPLVHRGARINLLDEIITVDRLAALAGTISYEILTSLGRRYARRIVRGGAT